MLNKYDGQHLAKDLFSVEYKPILFFNRAQAETNAA